MDSELEMMNETSATIVDRDYDDENATAVLSLDNGRKRRLVALKAPLDTDEMEVCKAFLATLKPQVSNSGWSAFFDIREDALMGFIEADTKPFRKVYHALIELLKQYLVKAKSRLISICEEEGVRVDDIETTKNERVVQFRTSNAAALEENGYVCLDIPAKDLRLLYSFASCFLIGLNYHLGPPKDGRLQQVMQESDHVPMVYPFDHNVDLLFEGFDIKPNTAVIESQKMLAVNETDNSKVPYFKINGYVMLHCEWVDSKGQNSSKNTFKVLQLVEPSKSILENHFNSYLRKRFPDYFEMCSDKLLVNISDSQKAKTYTCLHSRVKKDAVLVFGNLANLGIMVTSKFGYTPCLQIWTNIKLSR